MTQFTFLHWPTNGRASQFIVRFLMVLSTVILSACASDTAMVVTAFVAAGLSPQERVRIDPQAELKDLSRESDPNRKVVDPLTYTKRCMLMHAIEYGSAEQFRELLKNSADPKRCDGGPDLLFDAMLLRSAIQRVGFVDGERNLRLDAEFIEVFRERKVRPTNIQRFLAQAARRQSVDSVVYAIKDLGADPNYVDDKYGNTPLRWALQADGGVTERTIEVVDALVKLGADPEVGISPERSALAIVRANRSSYRGFGPQLESVMLQTTSDTTGKASITVEGEVRESGVRTSP